jgi:predicted DNA-binding WGR domain protein
MKLHEQTAALFKKRYKAYFGSLPIDQAHIQLFLKSLQEFYKEDYPNVPMPSLNGKLPKTWKPEWVRAVDVLRFCDWTNRAYAIRAVDKDISAFAHNVAWDQRMRLSVNREYANLRFRAVWQALNSAAVHDWDFVRQVADESRRLISGSTCYHNIAKAVFFLIEGDLKKAASVARQKDKGSASYYLESQSIAFTRGLCRAVVAAAENDPLRVAHGIKLALINVRERSECSMQAQGLAAILRRIDAGLLREFDGSPLDSWDDELWNWTHSNEVEFSAVNLKPLSHELHETLVELKKPQWLDYKGVPSKEIKIHNVPPPPGITQSYWTELWKKNSAAIVNYCKENDQFDHFIQYRKLSKKSQPDHVFDWLPGRIIEWIRNDFAQSHVRNVDLATWFEKPGKSSKFWAINRFEHLVAVFVNPAVDKELFDLRSFQTAAEAKKFATDAIEKQKAKGFVPLRKEQLTQEKLTSAKTTKPSTLADPGQQAVVEFWQAFGVPKLQAQKIAKKAAKDMEKEGEDSILKEMQEKAKRRREWSKAQKQKQQAINQETAALERDLQRRSKANSTKTKNTSAKSATTESSTSSSGSGKTAKRTTSQSRRFEFVAGNSSKFWTIRLAGNSVVTEWGRIGSVGQTTSKSFDTSEKAQAEYDKLIREKTGKGYVEVQVS